MIKLRYEEAKMRMIRNHITQAEMIRMYRDRTGDSLEPGQFSKILNGVLTSNKPRRVVRTVMDIMDEMGLD